MKGFDEILKTGFRVRRKEEVISVG